MHEFVIGLVDIEDPYRQRKIGGTLISRFQRFSEINCQNYALPSTNHKDIKDKKTKMWYPSA